MTFPENPWNLKLVKNLGGSTGAQLVQDDQGVLFVRKKGAHEAHIKNEYEIEKYISNLGINVPPSKLYETSNGYVKLSVYVEGKHLSKSQIDKLKIRQGFLPHALVGNWDALGLMRDNVIVDSEGKIWYVDLGGSGPWRAMGKEKEGDLWSADSVSKDIANMQSYNKDYYDKITHEEIMSQLENIIEKHENALGSLSDEKLKLMIDARLKYLYKKYNILTKNASEQQPEQDPKLDPNLEKYRAFAKDSLRWQIDPKNLEEAKRFYEMHKKSYSDNEHKVFDFDSWLRYVSKGSTPWEFIGDKDKNGYVNIKKISRIPYDIYKLTGGGGTLKGKISGLSQILNSGLKAFSFATDDVAALMIRLGFVRLSYEDVKFIKNNFGSSVFGNFSASLNTDGTFNMSHSDVGDFVKSIVATPSFVELLQQLKSKSKT